MDWLRQSFSRPQTTGGSSSNGRMRPTTALGPGKNVSKERQLFEDTPMAMMVDSEWPPSGGWLLYAVWVSCVFQPSSSSLTTHGYPG